MQEKVLELCQKPEAMRDDQWEVEFLTSFPQARLELISDQAQQGPDHMPYFLVRTSAESAEPAQTLLEWLKDKGIGLAVNPHKQLPDYIFTYGMLWNYCETGQFFSQDMAKQDLDGVIKLEEGQKIQAGAPSQEYLPEYVREILRQFFAEQEVENMKVLVISEDQENYDLCFSSDALGFPPEEEHEGILEAISWFLPPHYGLVLLPEEGLPDFINL